MSDTTRLVNDAVMGDVDSIKQLAERLDGASPDAVAARVAERLRFSDAAAEFQKRYSDIMNDPQLRNLALQRDAELAASNPQMPYRDRLTLVGDELRQWLQKLGQRTPAEAQPQKKQVTRGAAAKRPATAVTWDTDESTEGPQTDQEIEATIDQMARARGQSAAIKHRWGKHNLEHDE